MKRILFAFIMAGGASSFAQTVSGTVACTLIQEQGSGSKTEQADIYVKSDGRGGVGEVSVSDNGFVCMGVGLSKFGTSNLYRITLTLPSGEFISSSSTKDYGQELRHSSGMSCVCQVRTK